MMPGFGPQIKEAMSHLKRLSDSKRRSNALKGYDILIQYHKDHNNEDEIEDCVKEVKSIIYAEYGMYKKPNAPKS